MLTQLFSLKKVALLHEKDYLLLLAKLPVNAAKPDINPPINAVIKINNNDEPLNGNSCAIF
jgi:hypothetical protein